jgi:hypothetical protein
MIVFGKTGQNAALVTLTAAEVLASFETDFSDGEIPETAELFGTATIVLMSWMKRMSQMSFCT